MASDSPRGRIDQFFSSKKKRKILSPASKSGGLGKKSRNQIEGSPSAKGSLESYLETSKTDHAPAKSLNSVCDQNTRLVPIQRSLILDTGMSSKDEDEYPCRRLPQSPEASGFAQGLKSEVFSDIGSVGTNGTEKDNSQTENPVQISELKEFATGFLSLYCSELKSSVSLPSETKENAGKRHSSSSASHLEEKSSKRRHCANDGNQSNIGDKSISSPKVFQSEEKSSQRRHCANDGNQSNTGDKSISSPKAIQSEVVNGIGDIDSDCLQKAIVSNHSFASQGSLRKCIYTSAPCRAECETPGSFTTRLRDGETPPSTRGSSLFSPGEAFWNEAILVADELLAPSNGLSSCVAENSEPLKFDYRTYSSNNVKNGAPSSLLNCTVDGVKDTVSDFGTGSAGGAHGKELDKEVSPLPVKHFDFIFEAKTSGKDIPVDANSSKPGNLTSNENPLASINHTSLGNNIGMCIRPKDQMNEILDAHGTAFKCLISKRSEDHLNQDSHNFASTTPDREYNKVAAIHECKSNYTPASSSSIRDCLDLSNWLPPEICKIYNKKGISKLYPWQVDCLQVDGVLHNRNLVYSASTSAGKSFVAEILMLRRVLATGKIALLVLPYVSICTEKAEHLEALLEPLDKHVRSFYGNQGGGTLPKDTSVAVCTIEKANCLINRLLEEGRLSELGTIVIDELHMVGDQSRGYLLELMLTKLRYAAGEGNVDSSSGESSGTSSGKFDPANGLQIVGMSATLPNVAAVADWLQAALYETDFRPVPLEEYIKIGTTIYNKEMEVVRTLPKVAELGGKDPDHIVELCNEVVQEGHSVLIFCSSRKGCESTARHIAKYLKRFSVSPCAEQGEPFDVAFAIDSLRRSPAGLDPILEETLPCGVAYHHAGLTVEERETVETCYRKGLVRVLTATSTLAAGVNLPARRVIFRQPRIGRDFIDGTRYRQMAGRAGRTGIDTKGESVLICKPEETKKILAILNDSCPPLYSCLSEDRNGMTHAILEVVAGGIVQTASDIHRYVRCTLLNSTKPFEDVVKSAQDALRWLCHKKFLEWSEETKLYTSTPLGRASFGSSLCPEESLIVLDDLMRAREGFVLASDLHLVYLVTPINVDVEPDWELYYERFMQLSSLDQSVGNRVGVQEPFLMRMAHGAPPRASHRSKSKDNTKGFQGKFDHRLGMSTHGILTDDQILRVCRRFYVALILSRLVQEIPVGEVCEGFKVARGMVQALQENAGRFASMVSVFCEKLGWNDLESLVGKFQNRVSFGVRAEIVELTSIPYIKGSRARALYKAGLRTPQAIAEASIPEIAKALFESSSWSEHGSAQRKLQMGVAKRIKNGARKIVLDKAEEARVAAFSAFKSLGLDVPQICRPLLSVATGSQKESAFSPGEEATSKNAVPRHSNNMLSEPSSGDRCEIAGVISETKEDKSTDTPAVGFASSEKENSAGNAKSEILVEKPVLLEEWANTLNNMPSITANCIGMNRSTSHPLTDVGDIRNQSNEHLDHVGQQQPKRKNICTGSIQNSFEKGPVNAMSIPGGLESFLDLWDATKEFFFDIHFTKKSELNSIAPFEIHGIAICWENTPVYYLNIPKDIFRCSSQGNGHATGSKDVVPPKLQVEIAKKRWSRIGIIMGKKDVRKFTWNLKVQIQVLKNPAVPIHKFSNLHGGIKSLGLDLIDNSYFMFSPVHMRFAIDMCVVAWILAPDEERSSYPNLEKEVKRRLSSDAAGSANRSGRWKDQTRRAAHNGCCRRVAQTRALFSVLWKLLESEELVEPLMMIEVRLANVLADMEIWGIGVDMEGCLRARHILGRKLKCLEREAYKLAGKTFSLSMPADIASILYEHLKLPMPEGYTGKQHPSTDKHCLDVLRNEHPIVPVIKEHRTLAKLLNSTLGSICSLARLSMRAQKYTLHGHWLQTSTATGRISMEEPNLQCVEHMIEFKMKEDDGESDGSCYKINARDFFVPTQDDWLLLTADYSQIELRLMAHFSKDYPLIKLLSSPQGDVFTMIAAKWSEKHESSVTSQERDQTKRLVYGILYGMGPSTLAEQLDCSPDEAAERIRNFKTLFPGVAAWLQEVVTSCYKKGYVETLKGRKRFLEKIKFGNSKEKSKAQRQAVNSICQGSAADIIKIAMICLHDVIGEDIEASRPSFIDAEIVQILKGRCRILLQVHDELVLEADPSVVKEAGLLLQTCMENAVSLLVPLPVKLKVGRTWGSLEPFEPNS
ncbi:helicase and polymerase-containing protein TEBICHI [Sesamum indicum]|uniref:Helicase and polymerase-containing protein TEBICHI n=1 Tax=Sesamum indicum TaxID=4182 RepID=A0A8M8UTX5_SESIN|nr:helicase and polymerase-containing protein TEBICHI [Sesamum indicum]